jgi:hypothetical protein
MKFSKRFQSELGVPLASADRIVNPFATRCVRPGALPYCFPDGGNAEQLIEKLKVNEWRGAIIGPHGTGKSTLLAELRPCIERADWRVEMIALHDGQRRLPAGFWAAIGREMQCFVIVDGFEQLGWWSRWRLLQACRRNKSGLLITAHRSEAIAGLPVIYQTSGDLQTVQHLVDDLLPPHGGEIQPNDVSTAFRAHAGNVRETMFALYELFEQRRRGNGVMSRANQSR